MINFEVIEIGETIPLSGKVDWEDAENRAAYLAAQEFTHKTGILFSIEPVYKEMPSGRKISGYSITRTK